jgi:hypothetical protein
MVGGHRGYVVVVVVGHTASNGHQQHLEADERVLVIGGVLRGRRGSPRG